MARRFCIAMLLTSIFGLASAEVITPVDVIATSEFGAVEFFGVSDIFVTDLIDGGGLIDIEETPDYVLDDLHDNDATWVNGWHSGDFDAGIPGGTDDDGDPFTAPLVDEQIIEFDLGSIFTVTHAHIWQQNQSGLEKNLALDRGVDEFEILVSLVEEGDDFTSVGKFNLDVEEGSTEVPAQVIQFERPASARRIRFDINSAHSGLDNEFVGLGEVRFEGLPVLAIRGDFNSDSFVDADDINLLSGEVIANTNNPEFDLNGDGQVNQQDRIVWVEEVRNTYFGDANLDGEFNSSDLVTVFVAGEYEDGIPENSGWEEGDWNGDRDFDSSDFVVAFASNGYEKGPRAFQAVPEPTSFRFILMLACVIARSLAARSSARSDQANVA